MKSIGKEKQKKLEKKAKGITLSGWLENNYKHVTLSERITDGGKTLVVPKHNVELTIGLLSTDNIKDWCHLAFHWAPAGTIIDYVPANIYDSKILLLRQLLTKRLIMEPNDKMAKRYMDILERRDPTRWGQGNTRNLKVTATATENDNGGDNGAKAISLEFEIVGNPQN